MTASSTWLRITPQTPPIGAASPTWVRIDLSTIVQALTCGLTGPKGYLATRDRYLTGSTPLHEDVTSAVNIMVYSSPSLANDDDGGAEWLIFLPQDKPQLEAYITERCHLTAEEHPIHSQKVFINSVMLSELAKRGVRPFVIRQRVGEAVFIPAGCPHQVSYGVTQQVRRLINSHR